MSRSTGPDEHTRGVVVQRARGCCERCGDDLTVTTAYEFHHRQPRKMGGTSRGRVNSPCNLLLLCRRCHRLVESERADSYAAGWLVREPTDPARASVLIADGRTVLLTADGRYTDAEAAA